MGRAPAQTDRPAHKLLDILLVVFAPLAVALRPLMPAHAGEGNLWVQMCVFLALMAWALQAAFTRRLRLVRTGMGLPLLALLAIAAVSTLRSPYKAASIATLLEWGSYAALFFLLVNTLGDRLDRGLFLRVLWASAFVVILYGILQQYVNLPLLRDQIHSDPDRVLLQLRIKQELLNDLTARAEGRIFATFLLPNAFAGFLVVVIPGFVGHVLDRLRRGERGVLFLVSAVLWIVGALACLVFTYSKGGWLAFGVSSVLFLLMLGSDMLRRHARLVAGLAVGAALAAALLFATDIVPVKIFRDVAGSFDVRRGYWIGAIAMAEDNPVAGVGLGTFGAHYPRYRYVTARVAQAAHNDSLQVLAELGIAGLVAFLAVWALFLRNVLVRKRDAVPSAAPAPAGPSLWPWLPLVIGLLALALSNTVENAFQFSGWGTEAWWKIPKVWCDRGLVLALTAAWLVFVTALGRGTPIVPGSLCHKGLVCGVIGFLLHCLVDFDYYEPGVVFTAWAVVALSVVPRGLAIERRLRPWAAACLGAVAVAAMIGFQFCLTRTVSATSERDIARDRVVEAARSKEPSRRAELLDGARRRFESALRISRLDDTLRLEYGDLLHSQLIRLEYRDTRLFAQTAGLYARAAELNRASPAPHMRLAELFAKAADAGARAALYPFVQPLAADCPPRRKPAYLPAMAAYRRALTRDPRRASLHLQYASALEKHGDRAQARSHAQRAMEIHAIVLQKHPEHVMRLTKEQLTQARALLARLGVTDRSGEAQP